MTGAVVQFTGSFTGAFVVGGALALLGAVAVMLLVRDSGVAGLVPTARRQQTGLQITGASSKLMNGQTIERSDR